MSILSHHGEFGFALDLLSQDLNLAELCAHILNIALRGSQVIFTSHRLNLLLFSNFVTVGGAIHTWSLNLNSRAI